MDRRHSQQGDATAEGVTFHDPMDVLRDPAAMRGLLLTYSEKMLELEAAVATQAPKVEAFDRIAAAEGSMCVTDAAKDLQVRSNRWLGNDERPLRDIQYIDLRRIQPVAARVGYSKIAKSIHTETSASELDAKSVERLSSIMGKKYQSARMVLSSIDTKRRIPVLVDENGSYSGFHQGTGETTMVEFIQAAINEYSLILIDEIKTSLHPRSQRRLVRALAEICREKQAQVILTTHSPYILEELPLEARLHIFGRNENRQIVSGVSANFAMTHMDDEAHPDCELFVEDEAAKAMLTEIITVHGPSLAHRCRIIPFGAANLGRSLGEMNANKRFPRPTCVFLDADNAAVKGCILLPGDDAPERVVFESLSKINWGALYHRLGREFASVADACNAAMTLDDHHQWVGSAGSKLLIPGAHLWQAMCSVWAADCLAADDAKKIVQPIEDALLAVT